MAATTSQISAMSGKGTQSPARGANEWIASSSPDYANYEAGKAHWKRSNPDCTPQQYEAAIRAIARERGV